MGKIINIRDKFRNKNTNNIKQIDFNFRVDQIYKQNLRRVLSHYTAEQMLDLIVAILVAQNDLSRKHNALLRIVMEKLNV